MNGTTPIKLFEGNTFDPVWSPDGKHIAFAGRPKTLTSQIYIVDSDGKNLVQIMHGPDRLDTFLLGLQIARKLRLFPIERGSPISMWRTLMAATCVT
jgi:hypothetical protein